MVTKHSLDFEIYGYMYFIMLPQTHPIKQIAVTLVCCLLVVVSMKPSHFCRVNPQVLLFLINSQVVSVLFSSICLQRGALQAVV